MNKDNFHLESAKILDKKVEVKYHIGSEAATRTFEDDATPHPDFQKRLDKLEKYYCEVWNFGDITASIKGIEKRADKIQIKGMIAAENNSMCSLNTPFFEIEDNPFAIDETEIKDVINNIETEAFLYVFQKKRQQTEMEFPEDNEPKKEEPAKNEDPVDDLDDKTHPQLKKLIGKMIKDVDTDEIKDFFNDYENTTKASIDKSYSSME